MKRKQNPKPAPAPTQAVKTPPRISGAWRRLFANPVPGPDETSFQVDNTSKAYFSSSLLFQKQLQPVPKPCLPQPRMDLADVVGPGMVAGIQSAGRITFNAVRDTGAANVSARETAATAGAGSVTLR